MKKSINKYKILSIVALASVGANAKVVYTDVDPDLTFTQDGDEYELDFNDDGAVDALITVSSGSGSGSFQYGYYNLSYSFKNNGVTIDPDGNKILVEKFISSYSTSNGGFGTNTTTEFKALRGGSLISSNKSFSSSGGPLFAYNQFMLGFYGFPFVDNAGYSGNFRDTTYDKFLGMEFKAGAKTYYGWARIKVEVDKDQNFQAFTIYDYAYEDSTSSIYAGAGIQSPGSLSIDDDVNRTSKIYFADNQIIFESEFKTSGILSVYNVSGKLMLTDEILNSAKKEINVSSLNKNNQYVVVFKSDEGEIMSEHIFVY